MKAFEFLWHWQHTLFQWVVPHFELTPVGIGAGLIPDAQRLLSGVQSQPDIAPRKAFAHTDGFVEEADITRFVDAADRVNLTGAKGQGAGYLIGPRGGQPTNAMFASQACWCVGLTRCHILGALPLQK